MQNVLGTCLVLGVLAGGFLLTGDLGRLAAGGLRVIRATGVPDDDAPVPVSPSPTPMAGADEAAASAGPARPPRDGLDSLDIATLAPGSRIRVWIGIPDHRSHAGARCLSLDLVDPASGEALVSEMSAPTPGLPTSAPAPPRRARVAGSGPAGVITRGGTLLLRSRGIAGAGDGETLGPVAAIVVAR